ncbi:hypothetical protein DDD_2178 [Nonlabens dokdonensis DSW-6]|uniref:Uncharacterized protein n=1 Tax=Nonlabens dokdonensis (strain DSM 17205 / KCTC 12402 / DSW-6) TaxID=592029 RepID=L7W6M1_NONDD|nr:hypothetical protein DDD_2178 [Nonlabens dokdonensis DSW-6]
MFRFRESQVIIIPSLYKKILNFSSCSKKISQILKLLPS